MKPNRRKRPPAKATTGLSAVRSAQGDMRTLQKMLAEVGPHLETLAAMSGRIDKLEEIAGSLASELVELKALVGRFVAKAG